MKELVEYIQTMDDALIRIMYVTCVIASIIVLGIAVYRIYPIIRKYLYSNREQYKLMKKFCPELKRHIHMLNFSFQYLKNDPFYKDVGLLRAVDKYISYEADPERYSWLYEEELKKMEPFLLHMRDLSEKAAALSACLAEHTSPSPPVFCPILKRKTRRMLTELQKYALLWDAYTAKEVHIDILYREIKDFHRTWEKKLTVRRLERYVALMEEWRAKY